MKNIALLACMLLTMTLFAQNPRERLKSLKTAFITRELELTPEEAKDFWPVYEVYYDKVEKVREKQIRSIMKGRKATEEEAETFVKDYLTTEKDMFQATEKLMKDLRDVITAKKRARLIVAEREFGRRMLERIRGRH